MGSATHRLFNINFSASPLIVLNTIWVSGFYENPKMGWNQKRKEVFMAKVKEQKQTEIKKGLAFVPFYKVRKTKNGSSLLVYLNAGSCIGINIKYLLKVLEGQGEG
mgnify:CR=1 FL=1